MRVDVDLDLVALAHEGDRAAERRLGGDVCDHESVGCAGEAAVGDKGDRIAEALADRFNLPVEYFDPFRQVALEKAPAADINELAATVPAAFRLDYFPAREVLECIDI